MTYRHIEYETKYVCKHMSEILARDIVACISTCVKSMYKKVKHRYIQKSVRQTCSKEGIDSGGDCRWGSVREEIPGFSSGE